MRINKLRYWEAELNISCSEFQYKSFSCLQQGIGDKRENLNKFASVQDVAGQTKDPMERVTSYLAV